MYLDGSADGNPVAKSLTAGGSYKARIGNYDEGMAYGFLGSIDDVRIFNYALSSSEILDLFNQESSSQSSCTSRADTSNPPDDSVSITELIDYIGLWKSGSVDISEMMIAIGEWKDGC